MAMSTDSDIKSTSTEDHWCWSSGSGSVTDYLNPEFPSTQVSVASFSVRCTFEGDEPRSITHTGSLDQATLVQVQGAETIPWQGLHARDRVKVIGKLLARQLQVESAYHQLVAAQTTGPEVEADPAIVHGLRESLVSRGLHAEEADVRLLAQAIFDESLRHDIRGVDFDMFADIIAQSKTSVAEEGALPAEGSTEADSGTIRETKNGTNNRMIVALPVREASDVDLTKEAE